MRDLCLIVWFSFKRNSSTVWEMLTPWLSTIPTMSNYSFKCLFVRLMGKMSCSRPPGDVASQGPPRSWSSPSQLSSSPPGESGLPPGAEHESVSGSSPPPGPGFCQLSVYPKYTKRIKWLTAALQTSVWNLQISGWSFGPPLCWDGVSWLCRCCRSPCSWEEAECPCLWERCCPYQALHTQNNNIHQLNQIMGYSQDF